ncbi:gamma-glutamyltransferase [Paracoccaceae bacterium]|nr:gamma-glutamyltransferase [Paracoccaceae bacterium]MDC0581838.1 gamma-glutamyltransferase [Paracoccaceae bacterium]
MKLFFSKILLAFYLLTTCLNAQQASDQVMPETDTELAVNFESISTEVAKSLEAKAKGDPVFAKNWMVSVANPHAAAAGARVLSEGGTAADAMVAVQAVLGLVEPQSSGIGGGAFLVWYDSKSGEITTLDGRETAPLAATPRLFQNENGERLKFWDAVVGGRSVGVPGTPALMEAAHKKWGQNSWNSLFSEAIDLADNGFAVSPRLAALVARDAERLGRFSGTADYFYPNEQPLVEGYLLTNPAYADLMRRIAKDGAEVIYSGDIARAIIDTVRGAEKNPGVLSLTDLQIYKVKERPAVCAPFRGYQVCGMGPPSSGALTVGQILGLLNQFPPGSSNDPQTLRLIGDASRLAFADRGRYMADSDFVPMPTKGLLAQDYLSERAKLLNGPGSLTEAVPGNPEYSHASLWADDVSLELPSTSHISIVDRFGNALSMTTTIENSFGSRLMTHGFLLNNELTDFSFSSHRNGVPIANRVEPGKRPRSSMSPTIILNDGRPTLVIGSPGGSRIIGYVAEAIVAHIDWGMNVQAAVSIPHAINRFGTYDLEKGTSLEAMVAPLEELGYKVNLRSLNSGLHAISIGENGLFGGADPRREGIAIGQ